MTYKPTRLSVEAFKALTFLREEINHGRSPSIRDLCAAMGFHSSRSGFRLLNMLITKGFVKRGENGELNMIFFKDVKVCRRRQ